VSAALPRVTRFDVADYAREFLRRRGDEVIGDPGDIPRGRFDYVLCSHSLEHYLTPAHELRQFHQYVKPGGGLVLVLPIETDLRPRLAPDHNLHFQCWTFQTITNMLVHTGWRPTRQAVLYSPFMLRTLGKRLDPRRAVAWAGRLGRWKRNYPALLTVARSERPDGSGPATTEARP
jgi:SAM-dependent methyltransferase